MMSIITSIFSVLVKTIPFISKILGPIITPILVFLGLGYILKEVIFKTLLIFSILVGSGICFYFVMNGISVLRKSK
ncbi:MAG TPA: hypothetical protein PLT82_12925 [Candidatus Hydrogenedens sp.]|mgnify:FL=1|nr:hypothetical protein [Candidatus Hydrogenedens sp.]